MSDNDESDMDSLDNIQVDAHLRRMDAEASAKAFAAIEALSEVLLGVRDEKHSLIESAVLVEQLKRLAFIAEDYFAARGNG